MTATEPTSASPASNGDLQQGHSQRDPLVTVDVLLEALPYIQEFHGSVMVIKFGGNAMTSPELFEEFARDILLMHQVGIKPIIVHGGGPQIAEWLTKIGKESTFVDGRRVTDTETLEIVQMVLIGKVNASIVSALNRHGPVAVGLSGTDALLLEAEVLDPQLGYAGGITHVNPALITRTLASHMIPVIATIGSDTEGQTYNINADDAAQAIASELQAEKLIYLTDVPGLMSDVEDPTSVIGVVTPSEIDQHVESGLISGGMVPKMAGCKAAVLSGVGSVHLIDGRKPHALLLELFTELGVGTMVVSRADTTTTSGNQPSSEASQ